MKLRDFYARYASWALGMSPQDAFQLQRVLQMDERYQSKGLKAHRQGPGGGADATPFTVGFMLLGAMANGSRAEAIETVWHYWHIETEGSETSGWVDEDRKGYVPCPFTRQPMFGEALRFLLQNPEHADLVERIEVVRGREEASIYWREGGEVKRSRFISEHDKARADQLDAQGAMKVVCTLGGKAFAEIANDLREVSADD